MIRQLLSHFDWTRGQYTLTRDSTGDLTGAASYVGRRTAGRGRADAGFDGYNLSRVRQGLRANEVLPCQSHLELPVSTVLMNRLAC